MKSELFAKILSIVADVTELSTKKIISMCKTEECVAARALFVHFCCKYGVPTCAIKDYLGRKRNDCITHANSAYYAFRKSSLYFRDLADMIERKLSSSDAQMCSNLPTSGG